MNTLFTSADTVPLTPEAVACAKAQEELAKLPEDTRAMALTIAGELEDWQEILAIAQALMLIGKIQRIKALV